jgi:extracellular elastinolytic metalloproteinase
MRHRPLFWAASAILACVLLTPSAAVAVVAHEHDSAGTPEFDSRTAVKAPTRTQRLLAKRLRAAVTWSQFGTPATLTRHGRFLASGIRARNAVGAARAWLRANRTLLGLGSTANLVLDRDTRLSGSRGHAVNFRQRFGRLLATDGGLVTVGLTGSAARGWKVAYVSSSLTKDRAAAGRARLSAAQAWVRAAHSVGESYALTDVQAMRRSRGWLHLRVAGADALQQVKLVAFPTVRRGVAPAWETLVTEQAEARAYRIFVDARDGRILARYGLVQNLAAGLAVPATTLFSGELPETDGGCRQPRHGPFAVGAGIRALDVVASADHPLQDIVLRLYFGTTLVAEADSFFTPESIHYEPAGGVPAGDYFAEVCEFPGGGGPLDPRTYSGTFRTDDTPAPPPYLARWQAFPANPPLAVLPADPWGNPDTDTRERWCWREGEAGDCDRIVGNLASRAPWDFDHRANLPTFTTVGNNAVTATSWEHPLLPSPPQYRPTSSGRDYSFPWTNDWFRRDCDPGSPTPGAAWDDSAAVVNLFAMHNRMHDWSYFLGFTEQNWNAQAYNFGRTETRQENDPVVGNVQAGALAAPPARDNANMITLPDGLSPITNMYFWQPLAAGFYAPCVDGDYDMGVIAHEYTHLIENRMIGKGTNRTGHHAGAMGESHADLTAMEYQNEYGFVPTEDENPFAVGTYTTGNKIRGIRNYGMNFATSGAVPEPSQQLLVNALNFSDMGYDVTGPQVHADGEIWSKTNFAIRQALIAKYSGAFPATDDELQQACADGELPPRSCPGNRRWIQLVFDSYLLMPPDASMLQARDAQLAADLMRFGGANQTELWLAFARRGFGLNASSSNTTADTDTDPTPDFEPVGTAPADVTFVAETRAGGTPLPARIFVGHYEGRVSPVADTDPATSGGNLDSTAKFAPGTYELVATAPGYGHFRFRQTFRSGLLRTVTLRFAANWASKTQGATASGDSSGANPAVQLGNLIDDTEATNWTTAGVVDGSGNLSVDGKQVTVDLAGTAPQTIRRVQVSALLAAGQNRFTALRAFDLWACNAAAGADCSSDAGYVPAFTGPPDAFPGEPPRPVAPQLILRTFDIPDTPATHLRLVVRTSQCTGGPAFQGDQDADPANNSDCDSNVPANAAWRFVRAAELQAFSASSRISTLE